MELAPYIGCFANHMQVVKASSGHFPLPFLISDVKRTGAKIMSGFKLSNFFLKEVLY
jgi:hypothetical protein